MLVELAVHNLGIIEDARIELGAGMTALTGETGAGKTMLVEALNLLLGGRAETGRIRSGQNSASVEAMIVVGNDDPMVVRRVVRRDGPSRCYINGNLATVGELSQTMSDHLEIHGQHSQQRLLAPAAQRSALDEFAGIDMSEAKRLRSRLREIDTQMSELGGDDRTRLRELDVLRFQIGELDAANLVDPDEDDTLSAEEDLLVDAVAHRMAGERLVARLMDESGVHDLLAGGLADVAGRGPFEEFQARLSGIVAEIVDLGAELRRRSESIEPDPERLSWVQERRHLLATLRRKYGDTLSDVLATHAQLRERFEWLDAAAERIRDAQAEREQVDSELQAELKRIEVRRRDAAPDLAERVAGHLGDLALAGATFEVSVGGEPPGDDVVFLLGANRGSPPAPLAKAASGGELSRVMLAVRLVLSGGPPTLVFDEVDSGIGGATATAVGRALSTVSADHQVLVVTHLAQVAAHAAQQFVVTKHDDATQTKTTVIEALGSERVRELSRMLSGLPDSESGQSNALELLDAAASIRTLGRELTSRPETV